MQYISNFEEKVISKTWFFLLRMVLMTLIPSNEKLGRFRAGVIRADKAIWAGSLEQLYLKDSTCLTYSLK